ncbi:SAC3/GANP family, partial [Rhizoctonia solani]
GLTNGQTVPTHFHKVGRNVRLIDSKRPAGLELAQVVNQSWEKSTHIPERIDIEPGDTQPKPALNRLESSRTGTPANATGGGVFAGFGAVGKPGNAFGEAKAGNTFGEGKPVNVFGETKPPNIFGRPESKPSNPFGTASTNSFGVPSANPFGKPATLPRLRIHSALVCRLHHRRLLHSELALRRLFVSLWRWFIVASGTKSSEPMKPPPEPTKASQLAKIDSPSGSKLSPFAASFVPKFGLTGSLPVPTPAKPAPVESEVTLDDTSTTQHEEDGTVGVTEEEEEELERAIEEEMARMAEEETARKLVAQQEAAKAAREAKLRDKLEAARKEEEIRKKKAEEERARKQVEEERRRAEEEQRRLEVEQHQLAEERARLEAERLRQLRLETLHSTTAELLFADILEILVHWKFRVAKRIKRRRVLDNMGLGRVGVAGAAEEVGELFDEDEIEMKILRLFENEGGLASGRKGMMLTWLLPWPRLWAPGVFLDIIKDTVTSVAKQQNKNLDEIQGWDVWLCTSGANKSSAEWLRKKLNARPTQLVDGTVSVVSITPKAHKKESAPGLVVFECSPHLGAAMNDQEWNDAWSGEANRIARLFSAMSNHASYTPSLMFVLWSTDHVAQHSEIITRKLKQAASHLADVSIRGEPAVAVLVDETVEEVFQAALASLELDIDGHQVVERSSVTESLSKQISVWHQSLSSVLSKLPTFDDEESTTHIAHVISLFLKLFNIMTTGIIRLAAPHLEHSVSLPDFTFTAVHDNRQPTPMQPPSHFVRQWTERPPDLTTTSAALVTALPSPVFLRTCSPALAAAERVFESALQESLNALEARPKKRMQNESPVRDNKKARLSPALLRPMKMCSLARNQPSKSPGLLNYVLC